MMLDRLKPGWCGATPRQRGLGTSRSMIGRYCGRTAIALVFWFGTPELSLFLILSRGVEGQHDLGLLQKLDMQPCTRLNSRSCVLRLYPH